jgi:hypothetical protein
MKKSTGSALVRLPLHLSIVKNSFLEDTVLRIQRSANGEVVFSLSGQMDEEVIAELETLVRPEASGRRMILDLKNITLVGRAAIRSLERCEANGIVPKNCAGYVREWITRSRGASKL